MNVNHSSKVVYVVVEVWRGMASSDHVFSHRSEADKYAERLRKSVNLIEDDVVIIETSIE